MDRQVPLDFRDHQEVRVKLEALDLQVEMVNEVVRDQTAKMDRMENQDRLEIQVELAKMDHLDWMGHLDHQVNQGQEVHLDCKVIKDHPASKEKL